MQVDGSGASTAPLRALGPRDGTVSGDYEIPVVLGLFSDTPGSGPYSEAEIGSAYFADAPGTVRAYYEEVSGGRLTLEGVVEPWQRVALTRAQVTRNDGALSGATLGQGGIGNFVFRIIEELARTRPALDWGRFDNDGPDGIPNSGDDDGFVDALAVLHPTEGAECRSNNLDKIWSHKWSLTGALGTTVATTTPSARGGVIRIDDYFVGPALSCDGTRLNEIGIFTHEVGHAFGLPDLYDVRTSGAHAGAGNWDLMASGAWGCDDASPDAPCHMGAWSKAMLGWVDVVTLDGDTDHGALVLPPVEASGAVYRIDAQDGSGEFFLLEHRARFGFDQRLRGEGLLVWQIDPARVADRWASNRVNGSDRPGVRVREADGRDDLLRPGGGRGDTGDPFPGSAVNRTFHAGSVPASLSYAGTATGLSLVDITRAGPDVSFHLLTRFARITLVGEGVGGATNALFTVDGAEPYPSGGTFLAAPFATHQVEASGGEIVEPGVRMPFRRWMVDGSTERLRAVTPALADTTLTAAYEGREVQLAITMDGGGAGIVPATVTSFPASPDLWFPEGQDVSVEVVPRTGFGFLEWTGGLAGASNPAFVTMNAPVFAGATLNTIYSVPSRTFAPLASEPQDITLVVEHGTEPVAWSVVDGVLPEGLTLRSGGRIVGAALETGTFTVTLRARDAIGLTGDGLLTLDVGVPGIPLQRAAGPFLRAGPSLSEAEAVFLDRVGNGNGSYDLGDFRAWLRGAAGDGAGIPVGPGS
jgi:M6 family metalloprotease-like protein